MGQAANRPDDETLDLIILNALILDWSGIYKVCLHLPGGRGPVRSGPGLCLSSPPPPPCAPRRSPNLVLSDPLRARLSQADIGIKGHQIVGIGKGGNPDVMAGVTPGMVVGVNTEVIAGENQIVTAGALDAHGAFSGSG